MIYRTNSKIPPLEDNNRPANFSLSIKSKLRPLVLSHSKPHGNQQIEQELESECSSEEPKVFPVEVYKDMLKGEKIYLETYYKDELYDSGYEPYIVVMGGEVTKRPCPSTTVVLTSIMSRERYNKLRARVQKICKPTTPIMSITWLEEIYRQKRKVQKQAFLFNEKTDIIDDPEDSDNESMPDYFYREIFENDFSSDLEPFTKTCGQKFSFKVQENKKFKDKKGQDYLDYMETNKYEFFSEFDEDHFKILKNRKGYKYFWSQNKEKDKKRNKTGTSVGNKKPNPEKQKKPRLSIKKPEKEKTETLKTEIKKSQKCARSGSNSFNDSSFSVNENVKVQKPLSRKTIDKEEIEKYKQRNLNIPAKVSEIKKNQNTQNDDRKNQINEKKSKKITNEPSLEPERKFTDIGKLRPELPVKKIKTKEKGTDTSNDSKMSDADFIKRNRQKKEDQTLEALFSKMLSKSRVGSKKEQKRNPETSNSNSIGNASMSQLSRSTPPKSQSDITQVTEKTITAPKNSKFR